MKCIDKYKKRIGIRGTTLKERALLSGRESFNRHIESSPTGYEVYVSNPNTEYTVSESSKKLKCFINNVALNDQKNFDEKFIHFNIDDEVSVGSYVKWRNKIWLIVFEELNTVNTHKTFSMKECNQIFKFKHLDTIYEIPMIVSNLSASTDGVSINPYLSNPDGNRGIIIGKNNISSKLDIDYRILVTNKSALQITQIDDFTNNGILQIVAKQSVIVKSDDIENNIANNPNATIPEVNSHIIEGDDIVYLGCEYEYTVSSRTNLDWAIYCNNNCAKLVYKDGAKCIIKITNDSRYIGNEVRIKLFDEQGLPLKDKTITIKGYF